MGYPGLGLGSNSGYFLGDLGCPWTHEDVVQHPLKSCGMLHFSGLFYLGCLGILWDIMGSSGFFWDLLDSSLGVLVGSSRILGPEIFWDSRWDPELDPKPNPGYFLGDLGCPWTHEDVVQHPLKSCGMLHFSGFFYLGCLGILWDILGSSGFFWDLLGSSGILLGVLFSPLML